MFHAASASTAWRMEALVLPAMLHDQQPRFTENILLQELDGEAPASPLPAPSLHSPGDRAENPLAQGGRGNSSFLASLSAGKEGEPCGQHPALRSHGAAMVGSLPQPKAGPSSYLLPTRTLGWAEVRSPHL